MTQPPPLPPRLPTTTSPAAEPPPLAYATSVHPRDARPVFDWRMFGWSGAIVGFWVAIVLVVAPRFAEMAADFKVAVPGATRLLFAAQRFLAAGGWAVMAAVPLAIGFAAARLRPGGRRALRIVLTLLFGALIAFTVLGLFVPMLRLTEGLHRGG